MAKQTTTKKNEVATRQEGTAVAVDVGGFSDFAGAGMENVGAGDVLIPRITIIQDLSPQLKPKKAEYIEGAKVGDLCDVGTGDLFTDGILFLPVYYVKQYLEWAPRASGEGLVQIHADPSILEQTTRNEKKQPILPNGNLIAETAQWFGFNLTADGRKSFIPMASTQLKKSRKWMTLATGEKLARADGSTFTPPLFYRTYHLTTAEESNNEGEWSVWKIERGVTLPELEEMGFDWKDLMREAGEFRESLMNGGVKADIASMDDSAGGEVIDSEEGAM